VPCGHDDDRDAASLRTITLERNMSLLERIRRLLRTPEPDHPLTEEEREEHLPVTAFDARASFEQDYVGRDIDPDEPRSGRF
jgi:hypothetical protein